MATTPTGTLKRKSKTSAHSSTSFRQDMGEVKLTALSSNGNPVDGTRGAQVLQYPFMSPQGAYSSVGFATVSAFPKDRFSNRFITSDSTQTLHQLPAPTPATTTTRIMLCICCPILLSFSPPRDTSGVVTPSSFLKDMPKQMSATAISDNGADCSAKGPKPSFKSVN